MGSQKKLPLFPEEEQPLEPRIPGLTYFSDFIEGPMQDRLIQTIDRQPWEKSLKRRVQQYGYKYDYKIRAIDATEPLGPLPTWADQLASVLHKRGILNTIPDQVIVNEYLPGQGIASHIDRESCFGEAIAILSLGSSVVMNFSDAGSQEPLECWLKPRSLLLLEGPARYQWRHGIAARKRDRYQGTFHARSRRVSLTFRRVLSSA